MIGSYSNIQQTRTALPAADTWVAVTIPPGAGSALLGLESGASAWRISASNVLNPASEGLSMSAGEKMTFTGDCSAGATVYVAATVAGQTAILLYQGDPS